MSKNKLSKFAEMEKMERVFQYPWAELQKEGQFPFKGLWGEKVFHNQNPIILELGCGRGEYSIALAQRFPDKNFIGIDIKGARMYTGANIAHKENLCNVAFLRTDIELLTSFFATEEISEIWITFPDPQMKKARKRLTGIRFLSIYAQILKSSGSIHLKTDSPFLYTYTESLLKKNAVKLFENITDVYAVDCNPLLKEIETYYESQWKSRGLSIRYLSFSLNSSNPSLFKEVEEEIPYDTYRSYNRSKRSGKVFTKNANM